MGGQTEREGRVEVCTDNFYTWGTVCDRQWSPLHTMVICKHLGYEENGGKLDEDNYLRAFSFFFLGSYFSSDYFGQGTIPVVMDYVNCSGSESNLWDCNHFTHSYGCTHSDDVGVRCQPGVLHMHGNVIICML